MGAIELYGFILLVACLVLIAVVLAYLWTHRDGKLARGIGAAGQQYNDFYQVGQAPQLAPPSESAAAPDPLARIRADLYRRNRERRARER